ncbi:hypothetical protein TNCV_3770771 [Trichonephila clavipes]|nr:hypothetical protein TNCV_3770771 [Trichonephila clavipes]
MPACKALKRGQKSLSSLLIQIKPTSASSQLTEKKSRSSFHPIIKLFGSEINQTSNSRYLGLTLDSELRFSQRLYHTSNKALKKLKAKPDFAILLRDQIQKRF